MSLSHTPQVSQELLSENMLLQGSKLEEHVTKIQSMSLHDMSKLAELLTLELALQDRSNLEKNTSIINKQHTLFDQLVEYQKNHIEYKIPEKYLSVLSDKQVLQLTLLDAAAVPQK